MPKTRRYARILVSLAALGWLWGLVPTPIVAQDLPQARFQTYTNTRFGYHILYPADFTAQGESDNGDGQAFTNSDGAVLSVWGGYNVLGEKPAEALRRELQRCAQSRRQITYRRTGKTFLVISGYEADGQQIFYLKKLMRSDVQIGFELVYPIAHRARYDREVVTIANSLRLHS
ncbi:MAG: hypothetical protein SNJ67_13105 [Chloracidobacterium sp.]|uniref:DUF4252 domain-containing protein n=1 Tax=Chloracidobacterium validum TaxID=2821543 RepID=A0ABX8B4P3_9BACT|nr:hypothetical protein [Chloracidobacterium validum]QUW01943.1 hypothetical protein J8C06_06060 [Chloracidobacterium validum]